MSQLSQNLTEKEKEFLRFQKSRGVEASVAFGKLQTARDKGLFGDKETSLTQEAAQIREEDTPTERVDPASLKGFVEYGLKPSFKTLVTEGAPGRIASEFVGGIKRIKEASDKIASGEYTIPEGFARGGAGALQSALAGPSGVFQEAIDMLPQSFKDEVKRETSPTITKAVEWYDKQSPEQKRHLRNMGVGVEVLSNFIGAKVGQKVFDKTDLNPKYVDDVINNLILENKKDLSAIKIDDAKIRNELTELDYNIEIGNATKKDIDTVAKSIGLKDKTFFTKKLDELNSASNIKIKKEIDTLRNELPSQIIKLNKENFDKVKNAGYTIGMSGKKLDEVLKKAGVTKTEFDSSITQRSDTNLGDFERVINPLNKDINLEKGESIKRLVSNNILKETKDVKDGNKFFKLTPKGEKLFNDVAADSDIKMNIVKDGGVFYDDINYGVVTSSIDNKANILSKQLGGLDLTDKLSNLIREREINPDIKTTDGDIQSLLYRANDRYNLGLDDEIGKIIDNVTGITDEAALKKALKSIAKLKKANFVKYKNIDAKIMKSEIGENIGLSTRVKQSFSEGKTLSKTEADIEINKVKQKSKADKDALIKDYKKDKVILQNKLFDERLKAREKELTIRSKEGNIKEVKNLILQGLVDFYNQKGVKKIDLSTVKKWTSEGWKNATSQKQIEQQMDALYKKTITEYTSSLIGEIKTKLKELSKRDDMELTALTKFKEANEIYSRISMGDMPLNVLEDLFNKITDLESRSKILTKSEELKRNKSNQFKIKEIKEQGINELNNLDTLKEQRMVSFGDKAKGGLRSLNDWTSHTSTMFKKIFKKDSTGFRIFQTDINRALLEHNHFVEHKVKPAAKAISDIFSGDANTLDDFGQFLMLQREVYAKNGKRIGGLQRVMKDPQSAFKENRTTPTKIKDDNLPDDFPLSLDDWKLIKDTRLGEIVEKYNTKKYKKATNVWRSTWGLIGEQVKQTARNVDGIDFHIDKQYFPFKGKNQIDEDMVDMGIERFTQTAMEDGFTKGVTKLSDGVIYEYNPVRLLLSSGRNQSYYSKMKAPYNQMRDIYNGKMVNLGRVTKAEKEQIIKDGLDLELSNGENITIDDFTPITIDGEDYIKVIRENGSSELRKYDEIYVQGSKGLKDSLNQGTKKFIKSYTETIAQGGMFPKTRTEQLYTAIVNRANVAPLLFKESSIMVQALGLIDAKGDAELVGQSLLKSARDLITNPSLNKELNKVVAIQDRRGAGNPVLDSALRNVDGGTGKLLSLLKSGDKKWIEGGTFALRYVDGIVYKTIFHAAYSKKLKELGLLPNGQTVKNFNNKHALDFAYEKADDILGSAAVSKLPTSYKNIYTRALFGLMTNQMKRVDKIQLEVPALWKDGEKMLAIRQAAIFTAANVTDLVMRFYLGKALATVGATRSEVYEKEFQEYLMSQEFFFDAILGQFMIPGKLDSIFNYGSLNPTSSFSNKIVNDIKKIANGKELEGLAGIGASFLGGGAKEVFNIIKNN